MPVIQRVVPRLSKQVRGQQQGRSTTTKIAGVVTIAIACLLYVLFSETIYQSGDIVGIGYYGSVGDDNDNHDNTHDNDNKEIDDEERVWQRVKKEKEIAWNTLVQKSTEAMITSTTSTSTSTTTHTQKHIYFIHIGKTGGTSIDKLLGQIIQKLNTEHRIKTQQQKQRRQQQHQTTPIPDKYKYHGFKHYDWTYIVQQQKIQQEQAQQQQKQTYQDDIITFFRNPIDRTISQFYFSKTLDFAKRLKMYNQTLWEFAFDIPSQQQFEITRDGMSGPIWLAGTFAGQEDLSWITTDNSNWDYKKQLNQNATALCLIAASHLEQTRWFGLLEELPKSMKLLQVYLQLDYTPTLPKIRVNTKKTDNNDGNKKEDKDEETAKIKKIKEQFKKLQPMDMWLYDYAKLLFDARYQHEVLHQQYIAPRLPPFPWE